ncbi:MAG: hypothetical protein JKY57_06005 [Kordiimonadaceae bacterium]|nr:hypothetical protein [Kordiimonadaceae bacterium]
MTRFYAFYEDSRDKSHKVAKLMLHRNNYTLKALETASKLLGMSEQLILLL